MASDPMESDPAANVSPGPVPDSVERSFHLLGRHNQPWTARLALDLLPETNGPKVEVLNGSVIVAPHADFDRRAVLRELAYPLKQAARPAGLWVYPEINLVCGENLFIPDIAVLRTSGAGRVSMDIAEAVLLAEIVSPGSRRRDVIDRPREYAAAGVPFFLRVDLRNRVPTLALFELVEDEYRPVAAAAVGSEFTMTRPFAFSIDPADLLDEAEPLSAEQSTSQTTTEPSGAGDR